MWRCHIHDYVQSLIESYDHCALYNALAGTEKVKVRLLHYYPLSQMQSDASEESWIDWNNDSGFLTCLDGDVYPTHHRTPLSQSPVQPAGLIIVSRQDRVCKVEIPAKCTTVHIGECTYITPEDAAVSHHTVA
jgi:hypothetical protein